jgi:hypothetical protein
MNYIRALVHDEPLTTDAENNLFRLASQYEYKSFIVDYQHSTQDSKDMLQDSGSLTTADNAGLRYYHDFFGNRLAMDAGARFSKTAIQFSGEGENRLRTTSLGRASYLLDDPVPTGNAAGDFTTVDGAHPLTVVNVGRNGVLHQVSAALDFGANTEVDSVYVQIQEDIQNPDLATPSQISSVAHELSWKLFVSDDQEVWTERTVTSAKYNIFDNRFEIAFAPSADSRYVKVVTTPLSLLAPGEIRVLELQAYFTVAGTNGPYYTNQDQNYNLGLQWRVSDQASVGYLMYYRQAEASPSGSVRTAVSHSADLRYVFSPIFIGTTRLLRSESNEVGQGREVDNTLTASLAGHYLDSFSQTLAYSDSSNTADDGQDSNRSLFLRNQADLYQGWSATVDCGKTWTVSAEGESGTSLFLRTGTSLIPNRTMHFNLSYQLTRDMSSGGGDSRSQSGSFQGFWVPISTMSLLADLSFQNTVGASVDSSVRQSYAVSWSPFLEGDLQFSVSFHQDKDTEGNSSRSVGPTLRWTVARGVLVSLDYSTGTTENYYQSIDFDSIAGNVRVNY